jgi:YD repeat-containing protein
MKVNDDSSAITNQYDALDRLTNRLDGLGQTRYSYAVLGNGQRTFTEDGPWANDEVTVTNRYGRRAGLRLAQPSGAFAVTNAWDTAGRWPVVAVRRAPSPTATPRPTWAGRPRVCRPASPCPGAAT